MTATFFVMSGDEYVRVFTSVPKPDGSGRAIGTFLDPAGKAIAEIRQGKPFYGEVTILGTPYVTGYEPMKDGGRQRHRHLLRRLQEVGQPFEPSSVVPRRSIMSRFDASLTSVAAAIALASMAAKADVVTDWNATGIEATAATYGGSTGPQARILAMAHGALFDAVNAIDRRYQFYLGELSAAAGASTDAAAATAAHAVLAAQLPAQKARFDTALAASLAKIADGPARSDGVDLGRRAAERMLAARQGDGSAATVAYTPGSAAAEWRPTPPAFAAASLPHWGAVKPFLLTSNDQFKPPGMPAATSAAYAKDIAEIRRVGGRNSAERTAEQSEVAVYWTVSTGVPYNAVARSHALAGNRSVVDNARLFAMLNMVAADSQFVAWRVKYTQNVLRPVQAIREADKLGNPGIQPDPAWEPLIDTPAHPDYLSGHATYGGAASAVLRALLGESAGGQHTNVVKRRWDSPIAMEKEIENARVWSGIHTRTADEHSSLLGRQVAEYGLRSAMQPLAK